MIEIDKADLNSFLESVKRFFELKSSDQIEVFVGRIRRDLDYSKGLHLWVVSDNLLKGAAGNAVQIAEEWIKRQ